MFEINNAESELRKVLSQSQLAWLLIAVEGPETLLLAPTRKVLP